MPNWKLKPTSANDLPSYPGTGKAGICDIYNLLDDIKNGTQSYYLESGEYYYTAAFVDEYFYDDGTAWEEFVNAADREMTLASGIAVSADGKSSYAVTPIFSIKQQSIKSMYNLKLTQDGYNLMG